MTRQAERVRDRVSAKGPTMAKTGWGRRYRRVVLPRLLVGVLVVAAALGIAQAGLDTVLQVAGILALLVIAAGAAAVGSLAFVLRRRLAELKHLPDLGCAFVTNHEDGLVTALLRDDG